MLTMMVVVMMIVGGDNDAGVTPVGGDADLGVFKIRLLDVSSLFRD